MRFKRPGTPTSGGAHKQAPPAPLRTWQSWGRKTFVGLLASDDLPRTKLIWIDAADLVRPL